MIKNYIKIAYRSLIKNKWFSMINIFGLATGMAVCILLIMLLADQLSYDDYNTDVNRIYRVNHVRNHSNDPINQYASAPLPLGELLDNNSLPGIEQVVKIRSGLGNDWIGINQDKNIKVSGFFADPNFLSMFQYELEQGNPSTALINPRSVVLTTSAVEKLFTRRDVVGESITIGDLGDFKVTGVIKDTDSKSHIKFEALASFSTLAQLEKSELIRPAIEDWLNTSSGYVYLKVNDGQSISDLNEQINKIAVPQYADQEKLSYSFYLQPVTDITPGPLLGNQIGPGLPMLFVYFLGGLALLILLTATFNYTNLSIAKSLNRAKEIGIRKVSGAKRVQLIFQLLTESIITSSIAMTIALVLVVGIIPAFRQMKLVSLLSWDLSISTNVILVCYAFGLLVGVIAGLLPSLLLSSFNPVTVLKSIHSVRLFSRVNLRKSLVVSQFVLTIIFIMSANLIFNQLKLMVNADFGFNTEQVINVQLNQASRNQLKQELLKKPSIEAVSFSSHTPAMGISEEFEVKLDSMEATKSLYTFSVDENYLQTMGIKLLEGQNFSTLELQNQNKIILNERALEMFHFATPLDAINQMITVDDTVNFTVIGVIPNYHHQAMMVDIKALAWIFRPEEFSMAHVMFTGDQSKAENQIQEAWSSLYPDYLIDQELMGDQIREFYLLMFGDLASIVAFASILALIISSLGLLGMAIFNTESRRKEVSIRKVLGAGISQIVFSLSAGLLKLIFIAILIGLPLAYAINNLWLQSIAYRVGISGGVIGGAIAVLLVVTGLTVGSQTIRAALTNPVDSLKSE